MTPAIAMDTQLQTSSIGVIGLGVTFTLKPSLKFFVSTRWGMRGGVFALECPITPPSPVPEPSLFAVLPVVAAIARVG